MANITENQTDNNTFYFSHTNIAKHFNLSQPYITNILNGRKVLNPCIHFDLSLYLLSVNIRRKENNLKPFKLKLYLKSY